MYRIFLSSLLLCVLTAMASEPTAGYLGLMDKADKAISESKWQEAIEALDAAMKLEPDNPLNVLLLSNTGMIHHYAGNDSIAIETLSKAHRMAPKSVTVLKNRASVLTSAGHINDAIADYAALIEMDTTLVEPLFYHAMLNLDKGNIATTESDVELMKKRHPTHASTSLAEATLCVVKGRFAEAIPLLTAVIKEKATAADLATRSICYLMTDKLPEAADDISAGLKLDPTEGELYLYRALLNKMRYRPDDAKADAEKARMFGVSAARIKALDLQ